MESASGTDMSSGIFSDAVNISSDQYGSGNFTNVSVGSEYSSENSQLGMLVGDGIVLSPNEAQMFKKIQKIIAANRNLKKALVINSERLQSHVSDCIQWKENHKNIEDGLRDQLKIEKQKASQLQNRLDFLNTAMSQSAMSINTSLPGNPIESLIAEMNKQLTKLNGIMHSSNEVFQTNEDGALVKQAYEACISSTTEFVTGRNQRKLEDSLINVQQFCLPLQSNEGNILKDAISSLQNSLKDYQRASNCVQGGQQVPLSQHIQLKDQLDTILEENQQVKNRLKTYIEQCDEKDSSINTITKERDELQKSLSEKSAIVKKLTDELENCRSVEILDFTPQQQPKEIKQLEANIEGYKKTIKILKDQNETLNNDLSETMNSFEKIEEENSNLIDQITQLEEEIEQLNLNKPSENMESNQNDSFEMQQQLTEALRLKETELESLKLELDSRSRVELQNKTSIQQLNENFFIKEQEVKNLEDELRDQRVNFETKNRVQKNRESKDADRINNLLKSIDELSQKNHTLSTENEEFRQHIEKYDSLVQQQNLSQKQDFATMLGKSEELMSMDMPEGNYENANDEYTEQILAENAKLLETAESFKLNVESLQAKVADLTNTIQEIEQLYNNVSAEKTRFEENLHIESQKNMKLIEANKQFEEQLKAVREELNRSQQQANSVVSMKEYDDLNEKLSAQQKVLKKENQNVWNNMQSKIKTIKDLEEKIQEMTTELLSAKECIGELRDKERTIDAAYREKEKEANTEMAKLKEQLNDIGLLRMQLDVYKNDFEAERAAREKLQATLLEVQERLQHLEVENHQLKEELQKRGNIGLQSMRNKYGNPWGGNPQQMDQRNPYNQQMRPQGGGDSGQWSGNQGNQEQWQVYGRGNDGNDQRRNSRSVAAQNRMNEDEQRKCPKCQTVLPDLDSLQIHVMECLDK